MQHDLYSPRVIVASGMAGTGVSTLCTALQRSIPSINVIDAGSRWADISEACMPGFARLIVVTTADVISVSCAYALIKMARDRFADAPIEVLVNHSDERHGLKTYERIQLAASHFLGETVGYAGSVPNDVIDQTTGSLGDSGAIALQNLALRLDDELVPTAARGAWRTDERRLTQ